MDKRDLVALCQGQKRSGRELKKQFENDLNNQAKTEIMDQD